MIFKQQSEFKVWYQYPNSPEMSQVVMAVDRKDALNQMEAVGVNLEVTRMCDLKAYIENNK